MTTDSEIEPIKDRVSIEYRDTALIIGPALSKLTAINNPSSDIMTEAAKEGFFDVHQPKSALDKMAVSLLKSVEGEGQ